MDESGPKLSLLERLRAKFPPGKVEQRKGPGGKLLDYIAIETVLNRLLDVAPHYNIQPYEIKLELDAQGRYVAHAVVELNIDGKTAVGVGAHQHADPDMALKSATSEAIKNAAKNGWGVMLYLWDEDERNVVADQRAAIQGNLNALRRELLRFAEDEGMDVSDKKKVADTFKVDISDGPSLLTFLRERGRL